MMVMLVVSSVLFASCGSNKVMVYPIDKQDFFRVQDGETFTADRDGYFVSDFSMKEIMDAKVE